MVGGQGILAEQDEEAAAVGDPLSKGAKLILTKEIPVRIVQDQEVQTGVAGPVPGRVTDEFFLEVHRAE